MLTESLQNKIEKLLNSVEVSEQKLSMIELQGYLYAVVITPEVILPSDWLPEVFGGDMPEYDSTEQAGQVVGGLMGAYNHYNNLNSEGRLKFPFDIENFDVDQFDDMIDWSFGFLTGLHLHMEIWLSGIVANELDIDDYPVAKSVGVVRALADADFDRTEMLHSVEQRHLDEGLSQRELEIRLISELIMLLPVAIETLQEFGEAMEHRRLVELGDEEQVIHPVRSNKIGRNQPCPCGSGKKYKKCCALKETGGQLH